MSWLGQGFSRESMKSMADAFAEVTEGMKTNVPGAKIGGSIKKPNGKTMKVEAAGGGTPGKGVGPTASGGTPGKGVGPTKSGGTPGKGVGPTGSKGTMKFEEVIEDSYSVSVEDGIALEEGKKKCKDGYEYDSDEKKCVKKKKNKTTVIIGRGYYGGHHHHDDDDKDNGGDDNGGDGGGGDAGGGDGGGGGGE